VPGVALATALIYAALPSNLSVGPRWLLLAVVRQAAGLEEPEPLPGALPTEDYREHIPTLGEFQSTFDEWIGTAKAEQKGTVKFYRESYQKLLDYGPWCHLTLAEIEEPEMKQSDCEHVFTSPQDTAKPLGPWVLEEQMAQLRKKIKTHPDAGLHALRHTFLTEAGEYTDPFTLQYVAGHDNIKTAMRYVHPREEAVEKLFVRLGDLERPEGHVECEGSVQNPVQWDGPSDADIAKLLSAGNLRTAEVVELADTPS
jgi:hypothetical protein